MEFRKHQSEMMGMYVQQVENDPFGRTEIEWAFNLAENPELAEQYLAWLAEGNTPEPWEAPDAD